jgi:hypothetical protein
MKRQGQLGLHGLKSYLPPGHLILAIPSPLWIEVCYVSPNISLEMGLCLEQWDYRYTEANLPKHYPIICSVSVLSLLTSTTSVGIAQLCPTPGNFLSQECTQTQSHACLCSHFQQQPGLLLLFFFKKQSKPFLQTSPMYFLFMFTLKCFFQSNSSAAF